jgi:hypothetical protein
MDADRATPIDEVLDFIERNFCRHKGRCTMGRGER